MLVFYGLINSTLWAFGIKMDIETGLTIGPVYVILPLYCTVIAR